MENHEIKKILAFLSAKFPENWVDTYITEKLEEGENVQEIDAENLALTVNESIKICFDFFYISVLSGEYISNVDFNSDLQNLETFVDRNFSYMGDGAIQATLESEIKNNLVGSIKIALKFYKNFFKLLETFFKYPNLDVVSVSNPAISKLINDNSFDKVIKEKLEFFNLLIAISRSDHFLRDDIIYYDDLIEMEHLIKNLSIPPATPNRFAVVLREKVQYLKYKWEIRQRTLYGKKNHIYMKSYLTDDELIVIDNNPINRSGETTLLKWQNYLESHYQLGEWKSKIETEINNINRTNLTPLSCLDLHNLVKYYKDVSPNYDNLSEIVSEIEKRLQNATSEIHTYNKVYSYALNNQFSLLLTQTDISEDNIYALKKKIDSFQSKTKIDNFFVEYKYIGFLLDKIEITYASRKSLDSIDSINELIIKVEEVIKAYSKNLSWAKNHYHCVFQLPYEESLVECTLPDLPKIYYASSFVLSLSRIESQDNFDDLIMKYNKLSTSIKVITSLTKEFSIIQKTTESLKDNDFKSIEVIGVFSAIITFIMASIPAFKFVDSIWKALLFTTSISASLSLFLLVIFSIRKGVKKLFKEGIAIISVSSILVIIACSLIIINCEGDKKLKKEVNLLESTKDSLQIVRDSLKVMNANLKTVSNKKEDYRAPK